MAIQTGAIKYRGSFKSIRNYMNLHDTNTYAGEKGGANRNLILNNPAFARTRENMQEFAGCGTAVRAIRRGFLNLLPEQTDTHFTGRLMSLVKNFNRRDIEGIRGKRAILFSTGRPLLLTLVFNVLQNMADLMQNHFVCTHPITRIEATLKVTDLLIKPVYVPEGATYFRVQNHLSIISDYTYSELDRRYEPVGLLNSLSTFKYSEYTPVGTALTADVLAAFPVGTELTDDCSVIQCVGIEFYIQAGANYLPVKGSSSMMVVDAF
jgi:hypothetical protein